MGGDALPVEAAISYYESQALPWERAAFIRARAAAGDRALGERFLAEIQPFIWRRALDFGAIDEIRDISVRIRDHYAQGQAFGPGFDLKRGRGGIREAEFFTQVQQLIHGGRQPALRELIGNRWVYVIAKDPASARFWVFYPDRGFMEWAGPRRPLPRVAGSSAYYRGRRDFLPPALIGTAEERA